MARSLFDISTGNYQEPVAPYQFTPAKDYTKVTDLFRIKGTDKFGTVLATDSKGMKVFEVKGGGIEVVAADQIEEVFPFTFAVEFVGSTGSKEYHFQGDEGQVKVGDVMIYRNGTLAMVVVTALDTKSRSATKRFNGYKLEASPIQ